MVNKTLQQKTGEDIVALQKDLQYVKSDISEIKPKVNQIYELLNSGAGKIASNRQQITHTQDDVVEIKKRLTVVETLVQDIKNKMAYYAGGIAMFLALIQIGITKFL